MARFDQAVAVLQVDDVSVSIDWYSKVLGFEGWTFPKAPPYSFALLSRDGVELMFQRGTGPTRPVTALDSGWAVYIRLRGGDLLELAAEIRKKTKLLREPTRMPYREVEFMVEDPDGHVIVLGEQLPDDVEVPSAIE
jgi:catechol 2,3-dioxygenase-like lactoylglutathione lyase family enzyme